MTVIWLNGAIGSGKSTVGAALAALLPRAAFVDGDDHAGPRHLPNRQRWRMALEAVLTLARRRPPALLVIAYPLDGADIRRVRAGCAQARRRLLVVNLATPLPIVLRGRGGRVLSPGERARVRQMHAQGYPRRRFAWRTLSNALPPVSRTARALARHLRRA
jgi:hypothetical protein